MKTLSLLIVLTELLQPMLAQAANIEGTTLSLVWGVPFAGMLLSIALLPIFTPTLWHHHFGKITAGWSALFLISFMAGFGWKASATAVAHALLAEYMPFIILIFTLYTVSGGILVTGTLHATPRLNTAILAIGTVLASVMGTTGAAMLLIRPLLRANVHRKRYVHVVIFFIFLVANIGGGLTPLGDPPLFLGFLNGVDFSWTMVHMFWPLIFLAGALLIIFYLMDRYYFVRESKAVQDEALQAQKKRPIKLYGTHNLILLVGIVAAVLMSGLWKPGISFNMMGTDIALQNLARDVILLLLAGLSLRLTPRQLRAGNEFNWAPILEVSKLFAGIFVTITPVITILRAGTEGQLASLAHMVSNTQGQPLNGMYFWATGLLSSLLDNAPTYLVFFNLANGDAQTMMGPLAQTLLAISMGSVFMGANTYIGNAPNFMIKAIAEHRQVRMPSFFGYMAWSGCILLPLFIIMTFVFL